MIKDMLKKKNWAIVGATDKVERYGYKIIKIMNKHGYNTYLVNPTLDEIDGQKVYNSILDIPEKIDVIDMIVGPKIAKATLKEAKELGIKNIFFQPGSFDEEVIKLSDELELDHVEDCVYKRLSNIDK